MDTIHLYTNIHTHTHTQTYTQTQSHTLSLTHTHVRPGILAKTPGASDAMFLFMKSRVPAAAEQDPAEDSCKASSSEKVHPPNVAIWVRVAVGGGVEVAIAVVASFVCVTSLVDATFAHALSGPEYQIFAR